MYKKITVIACALLLLAASVMMLVSCEYSYDGTEDSSWSKRQNEEDYKEDEKADGKDSESGDLSDTRDSGSSGVTVKKNGSYDSKNEVAQYLAEYKKLPKNYITKKEAKKLGWTGGSVERVAPGRTIGGDRFGNYENKLPGGRKRRYYECDIDTLGRRNRGSKRIVYSDDGLIYYTANHYKSFKKMPQSA